MTDPFILKVIKGLEGQLPGARAQELMSPTLRFTGKNYPDPDNSKPSGVMILLFQKDFEWSTVFIERTSFGPHAGQISLPGGKKEKSDADITATALRETMEEIGIDKSQVKILGRLSSLFVPHSNFSITPVVGHLDTAPILVRDEKEVKSIITIGIRDLFNAEKKGVKSFSSRGYDIKAPFYDAHGHIIWGATAMIMSEFETLLKQADL